MIALAWKEIREHGLWALLALVLMSAALTRALYVDRVRGEFAGVMSDEFQFATTFAAPIVGTALGLLQTLRERRRDTWAFLMHRPVSRTTLFGGKVLGGMALYWGALGLPVVGAGWWASTPGHVAAPFFAGMMLPSLADLLAGMAFYFAALLVGLRDARWWGSRLLPLIGATSSLVAVYANSAAMALALVLLVVAVFAVAAWDVFRAAGQYGGQRAVGRGALGAVLTIAVVVLYVVSVQSIDRMVPHPSHDGWDERIDREGRLVRVQYGNPAVDVVVDWGLPAPPTKARYRTDEDTYYLGSTSLGYVGQFENYRAERLFFVRIPAQRAPVAYYFVRPTRLIETYSFAECVLVARMGASGSAAAGAPPPAAFDESEIITAYSVDEPELVFPHSVVMLHADRPPTDLYRTAAGERICGVHATAFWSSTRAAEEGRKPFVVVTTQQIVVVARDGRVLARLPHPPGVTARSSVRAVLYDPNCVEPRLDPNRALPASLIVMYSREYDRSTGTWSSDSGALVRVPLDGGPSQTVALPSREPVSPEPGWLGYAAVAGMPPVTLPITLIGSAIDLWLNNESVTSLSDALGRACREVAWPVSAICAALAVGAALAIMVTLSRARRYAFSRRERNVWLVMMMLGGLPGLLALLALRSWPARVACPTCGRRRVVTRDQCEHCGAAFVRPPADGTEIFETTTALGSIMSTPGQ